MQYTALMGRDLHVAHQGGVAPDAQGVIGITTRGDDLAVVRGPPQAGNLRPRVNAVDASSGCRVPEVDVTIIGTSSSGQKVHVPRAPSEGLDGGLVVGLGELGHGQRPSVPDGDEVVIAASSELGTIGAPLQTTDLGSVGDELSHLVLGNANIVVEDQSRPCTGREKMLVPTHNTNTRVMAKHAADLCLLSNIPNLDLASSEANSDVSTVTGPLDTADVGIGGSLEETAD